MTMLELDRLLEKTVADAIGVRLASPARRRAKHPVHHARTRRIKAKASAAGRLQRSA